jgi:hypothetical protein
VTAGEKRPTTNLLSAGCGGYKQDITKLERNMEPREIAPGVYDVGVTDWNIRDFHGYSTDLGTTYNAFLIVDQKIALLDTVKKAFADQLLDNISAIVDPKKIDYVISNHTELDELPARRDRRRAEPGQKNTEFSGNPHGPLA